MNTYKNTPYGMILDVVYFDGTIDTVVPEQDKAIQWISILGKEPNIEMIIVREATDKEWLNHFLLVQAFKEALQSFDKPIDPILLNLDYIKG